VDEVVQLYVACPGTVQPRWPRALKAFARVPQLQPSETRLVSLSVALEELRWRNPATGKWQFEPGTYRIQSGRSATDVLLSQGVTL
jgi:beta-glucosidase